MVELYDLLKKVGCKEQDVVIKKGVLVGRIDDEFYICESVFNHYSVNNKPFRGATGMTLAAYDKDQYEDRKDPENLRDYYDEVWRMAVADGCEERGLDDFIEDVVRYDGDEALFDFSGYEYWDQIREQGYPEDEYPVFDCVGCGRIFKPDMDWDIVYNYKLLKLIEAVEAG